MGLFRNELSHYMYATRFGAFSGHHRVCQYREDITRYNLKDSLFIVTVFL